MNYQEALEAIPAPGSGCHPALLAAANCGVLAGLDDETIAADILRAIKPGRRKVPEKEVREAVAKARATATGSPRGEENRAIGWNDPLPGGVAPVLVSGSVEMTEHVASPEKWNPLEDMKRYLSALFRDDETPMIQTRAFDQDGSWRIAGPGTCMGTTSELLDRLDATARAFGDETAIEMAIGSVGPAGAWVRVNPMDGKGSLDANVTAFRNALVECDTLELDRQLAIIRKLRLPCAAITYSGGKSVHAVVKVGAHTLKDYHDRFDVLLKVCKANGLEVDKGNRNPSRFTRLAGVSRDGGKQYLIDTNCGCKDWDEWCDFIASINDDLPDMDSADQWADVLPPLAPCVIEGVLRQRHKMLLAGPSKAGKSFLLMELANAIATGSEWLGWQCARGRVLYINLELDTASCAHRFSDIWKTLPTPGHGMLDVWNLRGHGMPVDRLAPPLIRRARDRGYLAIIVDPLYKVQTGDENAAGDMTAFYNHFDRVAEATGAAVILCHHHSKGAQGAKRAQDRASGSGVFARDPDALLDMIQLNLTDPMRDAIVQKWKTDAIEAALDAGTPCWREMIPQADRELPDRLEQWALDYADRDRMEALAVLCRQWRDTATLWRIDGILREFPAFPPRQVWFRWPVHFMDDTGIASDAVADGEAPSPAVRKRQARTRRETRSGALAMAFEKVAVDGRADREALRIESGEEKLSASLLRAAGLVAETEGGTTIIRRPKEKPDAYQN